MITTARLKKIFSVYLTIYRGQKRALALFILLGAVNGVMGALGIGALIPLLSLVFKQSAPAEQTPIGRLVAFLFGRIHVLPSIPSLVILVIGIFLARGVVLFFFKYAGLKLVAGYESRLRRGLYRSFFQTSWPYLLKVRVGHVENTLMSDVAGLMRVIADSLGFLRNSLNAVAYVVFALSIAPLVTVVTVAAGGTFLFGVRPFFSRMRALGYEHVKLNKEIAHEINENMTGLKVIKSLGVEADLARTGAELFERAREIRMGTGTVKSLTSALIQPMSVFFIGVFFLIASRDPHFDFASFLAVMYLIQQIFVFVNSGQTALQEVNQAIPSVARVFRFRDELERHREIDSGGRPFVFERELAFENVSFAYREQAVLSGVSFRVLRGEMIGVVGESGAGKTTIADLILRLFEPQGGSITLDGVDAREISLADWRSRVGYIPQEIFLKNKTIAENIRFYRAAADDEELMRYARMAKVEEIVRSLPQGFDTVVGERGVFLSVGQRQRMALARVLARAPRLLILAEATSALDAESEGVIKQTLESLRGKTTIIMIAHRLSTIRNCDRLIAIENGRITEEGTPDALLGDPASYFSRVSHAE